MPKIPTFTARGRPTAEVASIKTNLKLSPTATPAASLLPAAQAIDEYYIKQRNLEEKTEANKKFFEIQNKVEESQEKVSKDFNQDNAINTFNTDYNTVKNQVLSTTSNKRIRQLLETKLDIEYPEYLLTVKRNSRDALEKENIATHNSLQNSLMAKHYLASDKEKEIIKKQLINNEIDFSNNWETGKTALDKSVNAIESDLFITDVEKNINNKNYGKALSLLKDVESSKFLDSDKRIELIEKVNEGFNKDLAKSNIKNLILNKTGSEAVGFELENTDGNKITKKDISSGLNELLSETNKDGSAKYSASNIIELSIGNNASVPFYKESLISGVANISDTGNKEKVLQGYELYKLFEVQNADETLTKTYKIAQSDIESYQRLDYSINVLGETFDSALNREIRTRAGNFKEKNIDDKKIDSRINELDFKGRGLFDFGEPNVNNIQAVENILKYTANMYFKAGGSEDTALDAAEKFLEKNFRIDTFGQVVRVDSRQPEWHDQAVKQFIKNLYDEGKINKETNDLDDIIPQYYDYAKFNIQGFTLINKKTGEPLFMQSGDFDEEIYGTARFTQEQIEDVIYKPLTKNRFDNFLIEFEKRKQMKQEAQNFGLGIYD
jgi:hypothetical protein|nr:ribonuclease [uncultured Mediterranean phage uvMED]BAR15867.1 ribonuclease [uncultured Mediterranean phage uvMED]